MSRSRKRMKRAALVAASMVCSGSIAALCWLASPEGSGGGARRGGGDPAGRSFAGPYRSAALEQLEERGGDAARAGYLPAALVDHPAAGDGAAAAVEARREIVPPIDPHRTRPAIHNPGGVDGDRPARGFEGGEP